MSCSECSCNGVSFVDVQCCECDYVQICVEVAYKAKVGDELDSDNPCWKCGKGRKFRVMKVV